MAGELVSRLASAVTSSGKPAVSPRAPQGRGFDQALFNAVGKGFQQGQMQGIQESIWQIPEVAQALSTQPVGAVTAAELRADGSIALATTRGAVEVAVSAESRALLQQAYHGMAASGVSSLQANAFVPPAVGSGGLVPRVPGILIPARGL